jgi:hypothetical protein
MNFSLYIAKSQLLDTFFFFILTLNIVISVKNKKNLINFLHEYIKNSLLLFKKSAKFKKYDKPLYFLFFFIHPVQRKNLHILINFYVVILSESLLIFSCIIRSFINFFFHLKFFILEEKKKYF